MELCVRFLRLLHENTIRGGKEMNKRLVSLLILLTFIFTACAPSRSIPMSASQNDAQKAEAPAFSGVTSPQEAAQPSRGTAGLADMTASNGVERLVIKNANLSIAVNDPAATLDAIATLASEKKGYVVSSNLYRTTTTNGVEVPAANITIRVPVESLNDTLERIKAMVPDRNTDILSENISGQDVTKEYTDLNSRLKNLENTEKQLQRIMEDATKTEDVLAVYNQLVSVREQIEVIKGQMKFYEESAALSMIAVNIQSKAAIEPLSIGGWKPVGVARNALQATLDALKFLANVAIWLVLFVLPVGLVIFLPLRFLWKLLRRGKKSAKATTPVPPVNPPQG
ncbi:MAG TPA: DUF4349 domain-containing protein [Anaerolinea thermolimosa]|uniref:DUF4349 domain-containing protein n=2 Tax=Anaerolinea thermolimosa TaxID=229919 RepID=A0A3D1JGZ6_9CHLR|nr:DUF4349 domain-containing protein [Anaerolinea thermolimosa]